MAVREADGSETQDGSVITAARVRDRAERVRRRELETALRRLEAAGEVTPAEKRAVARLSARLANSLVERWIARLDDGDADSEVVRDLLVE